MAQAGSNIMVTTIEKDETRYLKALKNIKEVGLDKRINLILGDALDLKLEDLSKEKREEQLLFNEFVTIQGLSR